MATVAVDTVSRGRTDEGKASKKADLSVLGLTIGCGVGSVVSILLFILQVPGPSQALSVGGIALLIAGACAFSGGLVGFLFGIPQALQQDKAEVGTTSAYDKAQPLEQISDWLTKILVGVGLTQITALPEALQKYAQFVSPGLGGIPASPVFAVALLVFNSACGFLIGFLATELIINPALTRKDIASLDEKVSKFEKQEENDRKAFGTVQNQLNPGPGNKPVSQDVINSAVLAASEGMRAQIYYLAHDVRSANWRQPETKSVMERTIPVFLALINSDRQDRYHKNHGQLGFALNDKRESDPKGAAKELTEAIRIRNEMKDTGWLLYEFVRAICVIRQEKHGKPSSDEVRKGILSDLEAAARGPGIGDLIAKDADIQQWLRSNKAVLPSPNRTT